MSNFLTTAEQFEDRVELVGYFTAGVAALGTLVYFGMLFFYRPVMLQSAAEKAGLLLLGPVLFSVAWWVPRHKNWARLVLKFFFLCAALFSAAKTLDTHAWTFDLLLGCAFLGYWVLAHPAAIAFFRKLSEPESRLQEGAGLFTLFVAYFTLNAWYSLFSGSVKLYQGGEFGQAMGLLTWSVLLLGLLFLARRGFGFARWTLAAVLVLAAAARTPDTFTAHTYPDYWKALGTFAALIGFALHLAFSKFSQRFFQKQPAPGSPPA